MDFGIDTVIYVILGLVFFVAQANKKKKAQTPKVSRNLEEDDGNNGGSPPSLLEELFGQNERSAFMQSTLENESFTQEDAPPLFSDSLNVSEASFDNLDDRKKEDLPDDNFDIPPFDSDDESLWNSEFDLRNAVIYSVILERKYV